MEEALKVIVAIFIRIGQIQALFSKKKLYCPFNFLTVIGLIFVFAITSNDTPVPDPHESTAQHFQRAKH